MAKKKETKKKLPKFEDFFGLINFLEKKNYDTYESTTKIEEADYNRWCEQLLRSGYMDFSRTDLVFEAAKA